MSFHWPFFLLLLALLPVVLWQYWRNQSRSAEAAAIHPDLALLRAAIKQSRPTFFHWRRDLPTLLFALSLATSVVALARPNANLPIPDNKTTIMLALDVSLSMNADDITPTRFQAAQNAAKLFVKQLPQGTKIGLVSFAGYAVVNQTPTANKEEVMTAIDQLDLGRGTAIGLGLREATKALPERAFLGKDVQGKKLPPAVIVLLSDGRNNRDIDPLEVAPQVAKLQVKTYTVGLGTDDGYLNFGEQGGFKVGFDAETLKRIAEITGGKYFEARSSGQLSSIYKGLSRSIGWSSKPHDVAHVFTALAGLLLLASLLSSQMLRRIL